MAYAFNDDRSKVTVSSKAETDAAIAQEIADRQEAVQQEASTRASAVAAVDARVSNILAEQDLDPNKDLELVDIRTGYDDTVYTTAGDAVRGQVEYLDQLSKIRSKEPCFVTIDDLCQYHGHFWNNSGERQTISSFNCGELTLPRNVSKITFTQTTIYDAPSIRFEYSDGTHQNYRITTAGEKEFPISSDGLTKLKYNIKSNELYDMKLYFDNGLVEYDFNELVIPGIKEEITEFPNQGYQVATGTITPTTSVVSYYTNPIDLTGIAYIQFEKLVGNNSTDASLATTIGVVNFYSSFDTLNSTTLVESEYEYFGEATDIIPVPEGAVCAVICKWNQNIGGGVIVHACVKNSRAWTIKNIVTSLPEPEPEPEQESIFLYNNSISKPFDFLGKTIGGFGDSITAGVSSPTLAVVDSYLKRFAQKAGASLTNWAISGSTLTTHDTSTLPSICDRVDTVVSNLSNEKDFFIIAGGTNDFNQNRPIGTFDSTNKNELYGAVRYVVQTLKTAFPNSIIIFITPIPYTDEYYMRHNRKNSAGFYQADYSNAIYEVATYYECSVVNGYDLGFPTAYNTYTNLMCANGDGCHPTDAGHGLYARSLAGKLL